MSTLSKLDLQKVLILINPETLSQVKALLPDKNLITRYPIWRELEGYDQRLPYDKVILFVVAAYHPSSPFAIIDNYIKRKFDSAELAEFEKSNGTFIHEDVILSHDPFINKCVHSYLRLFTNATYMSLMIFYDELNKEIESLNCLVEPNAKLQADARKTMLQNIKEISTRIKECQLEILQGDNSKEFLASLYEDVECNTLGVAPEDIALNLKEGRRPLGGHNPYL